MAESLIIDWLNENSYRCYPLMYKPGKEIIIRGLGSITISAAGVAYGSYNPTVDFTAQILPGDIITLDTDEGLSYVVETVDNQWQMTLTEAAQHTATKYFITKRNSSLDSVNGSNGLTLDSIILDANISYTTATTPLLESITLTGNDLTFAITGQTFSLPAYKNVTYPYYIRNAQGSLLVIGEAAKLIQSSIELVNQQFEPSVCHQFTSPWQGVTSLSFNGVAGPIGQLTFTRGMQLNLEAADNVINVDVGKIYGLPLDYTLIYPESLVPDDCGEIVSYINGVTVFGNQANFSISPGNNVAVYNDFARHRIYIGFTFDNKNSVCANITPTPSMPL